MSKSYFSALLLATTLIPLAHAEKTPPTTPSVTNIWAKTTVPGGRVSAAYLSIKSATPMKLINAESTAAEVVEIHDMKMNEGVMEMKALDAVDLPANKSVVFKPGGMHIMLVKVVKPIKVGDKVPLKLTFEDANKKRLVLNVDAIGREGNRAPRTPHGQ